MGEKNEVTCNFCGYKWRSKTVLIRVTCPNCGKKVKLTKMK